MDKNPIKKIRCLIPKGSLFLPFLRFYHTSKKMLIMHNKLCKTKQSDHRNCYLFLLGLHIPGLPQQRDLLDCPEIVLFLNVNFLTYWLRGVRLFCQ